MVKSNSLYKDDKLKGVAPVIGFLLVVAIIFLAAGQFQANVVPVQEQQEEANHFNQVVSDIGSLRTDIIKSSSNGRLQTQNIQLGMTYDTLGITQSPISGTILLNDSVPNITIQNAENTGKASNFWTGDTEREYRTGILEYNVDYNRFVRNSDLFLEHGYLYKDTVKSLESEINMLPVSEQPIINGKEITLYTLQSGAYASATTTGEDLTASQVRPITVESNPTSAPMKSVAITNPEDNRNITIQLPTRLSTGQWEDVFSNQMAPNCNKDDSYVRTISDAGDYAVDVEMCGNETYSLQMSRIDLQTSQSRTLIPSPDKEYIAVDNNVVDIREQSFVNIEGEVRDRYNNGVVGVPVGAEAHETSVKNECVGDFAGQTADPKPTCVNTATDTSQPGLSVSNAQGDISYTYQAPEVNNDKQITFVYRFLD